MEEELKEILREQTAAIKAAFGGGGAAQGAFAGQASMVAQLFGNLNGQRRFAPLPIDEEGAALRVLDVGRDALGDLAPLDACTDGKNLLITGTNSGTANTIHTAWPGTAKYDLVYLEATNNDTVARELTVEWGGVTSIGGLTYLTIPAKSGWYTVIPERILQNELTVKAFASAASVIAVNGYARTCRA